jgi:hypothetical protein
VASIYGSAVPLLYWVTAFGLMLKYWTNKFLVLRVYKRPPLFSEKMFQDLLVTCWLFVLVHAGCGVYFLATAGGINPRQPLTWGFNPLLPHVLPALLAFAVALGAPSSHCQRVRARAILGRSS